MNIYPGLKIEVENSSEFVVNVETGALQIIYNTKDAASTLLVLEPSKLIVPEKTTMTFALNGDTATITRL